MYRISEIPDLLQMPPLQVLRDANAGRLKTVRYSPNGYRFASKAAIREYVASEFGAMIAQGTWAGTIPAEIAEGQTHG